MKQHPDSMLNRMMEQSPINQEHPMTSDSHQSSAVHKLPLKMQASGYFKKKKMQASGSITL